MLFILILATFCIPKVSQFGFILLFGCYFEIVFVFLQLISSLYYAFSSNLNLKFCSNSYLAGTRYLTSHLLNDLLANGKPKPRSTFVLFFVFLQFVEVNKQFLHPLFGNSIPVVDHIYLKRYKFICLQQVILGFGYVNYFIFYLPALTLTTIDTFLLILFILDLINFNHYGNLTVSRGKFQGF